MIPVATQPGTDTTADQNTMIAAILADAGSPAEAVEIHRLIHRAVQPRYRAEQEREQVSKSPAWASGIT